MASDFSGERFALLNRRMMQYVERGEVAGAATLIYKAGHLNRKEVGWQSRENKVPLRGDTIFRIASMTKPVTSVAALILIERGIIQFDAPIQRWLPELRALKVLRYPNSSLQEIKSAARPITVRDLLLHRSGLSYPFNAGEALGEKLREFSGEIFPNRDAASWLRHLGNTPLRIDPGVAWCYGFSTDVLGVLVERAGGTSFGDFLRTHIFDPLQIEDMGFWVPSHKLERLSRYYAMDPQTGELVAQSYPDERWWHGPPIFESGGAGLVATIGDYFKFIAGVSYVAEGGKK